MMIVHQGGLMFRGLVQRCPAPPTRRLVTLGSSHQGFINNKQKQKNIKKPGGWNYNLVYSKKYDHNFSQA